MGLSIGFEPLCRTIVYNQMRITLYRYGQMHYWYKLTMVLQLTIKSVVLCDEISLFGINGTFFWAGEFFQTLFCIQGKREFFRLECIGY